MSLLELYNDEEICKCNVVSLYI